MEKGKILRKKNGGKPNKNKALTVITPDLYDIKKKQLFHRLRGLILRYF